MSTNDRSSTRRRRDKRLCALVLLCGLSASTFACSRATTDPPPAASATAAPEPPPPATPAGPDELALVAPLVVGSSLGDFEVREIQAVQRGVLNIVCAKGRSVVHLFIALASDKGPEPPAEAGKYAIFYSLRKGDPSDAERLAKALAEIVGKHSDVPVPKGMTEFVPVPIPI
ncbi:MAG: hypothetical protein IPM54_28425 [Polyangiaceae bacterium]|nr:hypothetical protein [Polyangiaceae bacterium]